MKRTVIAASAIFALLFCTAVRAQDASAEKPPAAPAEKAEAAPAPAADAPASEPAAVETPAPMPGPKTEAFSRLFEDWKKILSELRELKYKKYPDAGVEERVEISKRYDELIAEGEAMQPKLLAAALEAFKEAPNQDVVLSTFLGNVAVWDCTKDDYEKAFDLAQKLIEAGLNEASFYMWAGEAAFCTNHFDLAEKYLKIADRAGLFANAGDNEQIQQIQRHLKQIGYYKVQWAKEKALREAEAKADDLPRVEITTQHGKMVVELFENEAPNTVANFISLVKKGFYDSLTFHRVLPHFMAQGGCPVGDGSGGPGYCIECECVRPDSRKHFRGSLSMAHRGPDTGGSQFFLCFVPTANLDGEPMGRSHHTVFGRVIEGLDQLAQIKRRDPEKDAGNAEKIISMKVIRDRGHEYVPKTLPER